MYFEYLRNASLSFAVLGDILRHSCLLDIDPVTAVHNKFNYYFLAREYKLSAH